MCLRLRSILDQSLQSVLRCQYLSLCLSLDPGHTPRLANREQQLPAAVTDCCLCVSFYLFECHRYHSAAVTTIRNRVLTAYKGCSYGGAVVQQGYHIRSTRYHVSAALLFWRKQRSSTYSSGSNSSSSTPVHSCTPIMKSFVLP